MQQKPNLERWLPSIGAHLEPLGMLQLVLLTWHMLTCPLVFGFCWIISMVGDPVGFPLAVDQAAPSEQVGPPVLVVQLPLRLALDHLEGGVQWVPLPLELCLWLVDPWLQNLTCVATVMVGLVCLPPSEFGRWNPVDMELG